MHAAAKPKASRYSYDMLGEAAITAEDSQRYFVAYEEAIHAIGQRGRRARLVTKARAFR